MIDRDLWMHDELQRFAKVMWRRCTHWCRTGGAHTERDFHTGNWLDCMLVTRGVGTRFDIFNAWVLRGHSYLSELLHLVGGSRPKRCSWPKTGLLVVLWGRGVQKEVLG